MVRLRKNSKPIEFLGSSPDDTFCLQCNQRFDSESKRRMRDACGHVKCLSCVINWKVKCTQCFGTTKSVASSDPNSDSGPAKDNMLNSAMNAAILKKSKKQDLKQSGPNNSKEQQPTREKRYQCSKCGKMYEFYCLLKRHQASHLVKKIDEGDLKYECTVCGIKMKDWKENFMHFKGSKD